MKDKQNWRASVPASRRCRGSVMMEFTLVMPLLFMLIMGVCQTAHLGIARLMLRYASFCAARAVLVSHDSEAQAHAKDAAQKVMGWMGLYSGANSGSGVEPIIIDGWGAAPDSYLGGPRSDAVEASVVNDGSSNGQVEVMVKYRLPLVFPVYSFLLADKDGQPMEPGVHVFAGVEPLDEEPRRAKPLFPVLTMYSSVKLPRPWLGKNNPIWRREK